MARIRPEENNFNISDPGFYLDTRLTAIVDGSANDFTGKKVFTTGFFRKGVGFGIIGIDIEVNPSLQPIITITFKDLYGNTVFGKNVDSADYSVLFNWPPPKFLFTFKGFLGRQVSWLLNLKQTSTTYQSDGSYDIKCEFVPNQWGFMADLPFLFLLAVKGLKSREKNKDEFEKEVQTIFDLIKIGKKVDVKTKEVSKEYDLLLQQLNLLKVGRIVEAIVYDKTIKLNETIDGSAGNSKVKSSGILNFSNITINSTNEKQLSSIEEIKTYTSNSPEALRKANLFFLLNSTIGGIPPRGVSLGEINFEKGAFEDGSAKLRKDKINDNIKIVEDAIKKRIFESNKSQLRQITIGEIFRQLASDSGYIMGKILQSGSVGYSKNKSIRDSDSDSEKIIGKQYPLRIESNTGQEVPATGGYGIEDNELKFIDDFISALSEGIARNVASNGQNSGISNEDRLIKRINNIEAIQGNPYKPFYKNIAENIMVRSGIIAFLTRSNDPNYPGDYGPNTIFDRSTLANVLTLASADMENITSETLASMSDKEFLELKNFCLFWKHFISNDGENFLLADGKKGDIIIGTGFNESPVNALDYSVKVGSDTKKLSDYAKEFFSDKNLQNAETFDTSNSGFIDKTTLQAKALYNNKILYRVPDDLVGSDSYVYALFEGSNATKAKESNNAESDATTKSEDLDEDLLGLVPIDTYFDAEGEVLGRVKLVNDQFSDAVINYAEISNPSPKLFTKNSTEWNSIVVYSNSTEIVNADGDVTANQIPANNLVSTVVFHPFGTVAGGGDNGVIFGPFLAGESGKNHRACIKKMCVSVLEKMNKIEEDKNKTISDVLGNASEQKDAMYKQFHVLYHQWESLLFEDAKDDNVENIVSKKIDSLTDISSLLENRYGSKEKHQTTGKESRNTTISRVDTNTFIYDYPLNTKAGIDVKNSIIDIGPLYNPDGNTTVLNMIQQICTKNNFTFVPIPGNGDFNDYREIFKPQISSPVQLKNLFYIMFTPTPESRSKINNHSQSLLSSKDDKDDLIINQDIYEVKVGSTDNKIFKGLTVDTNENKTTAESIINLQRLTDNENQNKKVTTNCSMLPVMEGRSYKANFEMLGNAQIFPMQYFYLDSIPMFNGVYQVMTVKHSIKPNDMTTTAEGIRMRFSARELGGIQPITLELLEGLNVTVEQVNYGEDDFDPSVTVGIDSTEGNKGDLGKYNTFESRPSFNEEKKKNINLLLKQMDNANITNEFTRAAILSIIYKESGFIPKNENLYYTSKRIREVWPGTSVSDSVRVEKNPPVFGDWKYGGKYGNAQNEGYKFRGRGYNQITFKSAYEKYGNIIDVDLIKDPDKLNNPIYAGRAALAFFREGIKGYDDSQKSYYGNPTKSLNDFQTLESAVGGIYHINAGLGKKIATLLKDTTGGRKKAFQVSGYMLEIVKAGKIT